MKVKSLFSFVTVTLPDGSRTVIPVSEIQALDISASDNGLCTLRCKTLSDLALSKVAAVELEKHLTMVVVENGKLVEREP